MLIILVELTMMIILTRLIMLIVPTLLISLTVPKVIWPIRPIWWIVWLCWYFWPAWSCWLCKSCLHGRNVFSCPNFQALSYRAAFGHIASPSIAWWYCSPPSVSLVPWQLGPLQQGRLANDRGPAQIARLEDHTRDGSLPILLEAKDPDIDQPGKVQDTLVCVTSFIRSVLRWQ